MRPNTDRIATGALVAALGVALTACDTGETGSVAAVRPVTLSIGTDEFQGNPLSDQIEEFAGEVDRISDGAMVIEPSWHAAGNAPDWDQPIARMVRDGGLDMGLIPARGWDVEGVTSMQALMAPFGIESDALLEAVVQDDDLVADLVSGLPAYGVTGLALFPQGLRHPFSFGDPLLGPADYAGVVIRAARSDVIAAVFGALGATTTDEGEPDPALQDGLESSFELDPGGTATGNVTFYPKANVLVLGDDARAELDDAQLDVLQRAAERTRDWAVDNRPADADAAAAYCDQGGAVVLASDEDLAAMRQATAGVTEQLAADPTTAAELDAIDRLRETVESDPPVAACDGSAPPASSATAGTSGP